MLARSRLPVEWLLAGHGAVRNLLVGEYLGLDLLETAVDTVVQTSQAAEHAAAIELLFRAAGRSGEPAWVHLDAIENDGYHKCSFVKVLHARMLMGPIQQCG